MQKEFVDRFISEIEKASHITILRHKNPDLDALGSQLGLKQLILTRYPNKVCKAVGNVPSELAYIGEMDEITQEEFDNSLIIVTDTANQPRIDTPFPIKNMNKVIKIDHHPNEDPYGNFLYVDVNASSCSEIIAEMAFEFPEYFEMNRTSANYIVAGIIGDTGRFLYPSTTKKTFQIMSQLVDYGVNHSFYSDKMLTRSREVSLLAGYMYSHIQISPKGVGSIILTLDLLNRFGVSDSETSSLVALPGTIEGVKIWGIFVEQPEGFYRCRLRSKTAVINEIAKRHDGGGHPLAAGANAYNQEEIYTILEEIEQLLS